MRLHPVGRTAVLVVLSTFAAACGGSDSASGPDFDDDTPPPPTVAGVTVLTSPTPQTVGAVLPVQFRIDGSNGQPMAGVAVTFSASGGGTVTPATVTSSSTGQVSTTWTLGTTPGQQALQASASGRSASFTVTTVAAAAATVVSVSGDAQTAAAGAALGSPVVVAVRDRFGNAVAGATVAFSATTGGGSVNPSSAVTGANGQAATTWTLGPSAGEQTLSAQVQGLPAVGFKAVAQTQTSTVSGITALSSPGQQTVGRTVSVEFRVDGSNGAPLAGIPVTFSATGGGSVDPATVTSSAAGTVTATWKLGTTAGSQGLQASADGRSASVTANAVADVPATTVQVSGDGQSAAVSTALSAPVVVAVRDQYGNAVSGATVAFQVTGGGGSVSPASAATGSNGQASSTWTLGANAGEQTLAAQVQGIAAVSFRATAQIPTNTPAFNLDIRIVGNAPASVKAALDSAEARWEQIITGDLPDTRVQVSAGFCENAHGAIDEVVDDLVIFVEVKAIDGVSNTLAAAGGCVLREVGGLAALGSMDVDEADVQPMIDEGTLGSTMLHEIGHILGIGSLWEDKGTLTGAGTDNPTYTGTQGVAQYKALGGTLAAIPVENTGGQGTADSHWRTSVFNNEVMVGYSQPLPNPLSVMTIGALLDLGFQADLAKADAYSIPTGAPSRTEEPARVDRPWEVIRTPKAMVGPDGVLRLR